MSKLNYMEKVDAWFAEILAVYLDTGNTEALRQAIKKKVLESYRNGQRSARRSKENEPTSETK